MSNFTARRKSVAVLAGAVALVASGSLRAAQYYLDANYTGVNGAPYGNYTAAYNSISAALTAMPAGASPANPNQLIIAPGTYNTANSASTAGISYSRANTALIGMTGNPDDVVITSTLDSAYNPGTGTIGTTNCATLQLKGNNQSASGITFANSTDTPYIVSTSHVAISPGGTNTATAQTASAPAVALLLQGDQQAFQNCKILGYQDTLYTKGGRSYFTNCTVSGDNDFVFANGTTVFNGSTINIDGDHSGGAMTAASTDKRTSNGIVFLNSTITGNSVKGSVIDPNNGANASGPAANTMYLGRPWGWQQVGGDASAVYINDKMTSAIKGVGWLNWNSNELNAANGKNGGNPGEDSRFAEFNSMDLLGNPMDVSTRVSWSHQLTAAQAAAFTPTNLFSFEAGYPWYGQGYPAGDVTAAGTGSANPSDPNFSWPAYWGDRNSNNDTANATVTAVYPAPGNPTAYTDPSWTLTSNWDPNAQLLAQVPEPTTGLLGAGLISLLSVRRKRR